MYNQGMSETALIDTSTLPDLSIYNPKDIPLSVLIDYRRRGLTYRQIAKLVGCSHVNVIKRLEGYCQDIDTVESYKRNRADVLAVVQSKILHNITKSDITKCNLRDKVISMGVLYDKERLERGQSTDIVDIRSLTMDITDLVKQCQDKLAVDDKQTVDIPATDSSEEV